jgi:hypothetical protein
MVVCAMVLSAYVEKRMRKSKRLFDVDQGPSEDTEDKRTPSGAEEQAASNEREVRVWHQTDISPVVFDVRYLGRLCCKSRRLQGHEFLAKT